MAEAMTAIEAGDEFGRLVALSRASRVSFGPRSRREAAWLCACECGRVTVALDHNLLAGRTRSCGCLYREHWNEVARKLRARERP